jgi:hypothetical protein
MHHIRSLLIPLFIHKSTPKLFSPLLTMSIYLKGLLGPLPSWSMVNNLLNHFPLAQLCRLSKLLVGTVIELPPNMSDLQQSITIRHIVACELPPPPHPIHVCLCQNARSRYHQCRLGQPYNSNLIREANIGLAPQQAKASSHSFSSLNDTTNEGIEAITSPL